MLIGVIINKVYTVYTSVQQGWKPKAEMIITINPEEMDSSTYKIEICVCTLYSVRPSVCTALCLLCLGERLDGFVQSFLEGKFRGVSRNNDFDMFDVTHVKHKEISLEGKCCSSFISKYYIEGYCL